MGMADIKRKDPSKVPLERRPQNYTGMDDGRIELKLKVTGMNNRRGPQTLFSLNTMTVVSIVEGMR